IAVWSIDQDTEDGALSDNIEDDLDDAEDEAMSFGDAIAYIESIVSAYDVANTGGLVTSDMFDALMWAVQSTFL
ncbi:hypothetical protein HK405_003403, partial [Cladochytrium tenue]